MGSTPICKYSESIDSSSLLQAKFAHLLYKKPPKGCVEPQRFFFCELFGVPSSWNSRYEKIFLFNEHQTSVSSLQELAEREDFQEDQYFSPHFYFQERRKENILQLNSLTLDLDFTRADPDLLEDPFNFPPEYRAYLDQYSPQKIIQRCQRIKIPSPSWIVSTGGGYHVFWNLEFMGEPVRLGKKNRNKVTLIYEQITQALIESFRDLGADPPCRDIVHLFRVPFTLNSSYQEFGFSYLVKPVFHKGGRVQLYQLKPEKKRAIYQVKYRKVGPAQGSCLATPAVQWLLTHKIPEGFRNKALYALISACIFDNLPIERTKKLIHQWRTKNTIPPYPKSEAERVLSSCYKHKQEKGIDHRRLMEIEDTQGRKMDERTARSIYSALPKVRARGKPARFRVNKPLIESLARCLDVILNEYKKRRGPFAMSAKTLSNQAKIPLSTVQQRITPCLDNLGIRVVHRVKNTHIATYSLPHTLINPHPYHPKQYKVINFVEWTLFRSWPTRVADLWRRKFRRWWQKVVSFLRQLQSLIEKNEDTLELAEQLVFGFLSGGAQRSQRSRSPPG